MLGLVQNTDTWTRREFPSTETLRTSSSFDLMGHWSMHPSGSVCTSNLPPVLCTLTEKKPSILKWRKGMNWFYIFRFITGRYPPSFSPTRNKLLKNFLWAGWVLVIAPFLKISSNFKSTRAICFLFIVLKFGISCWKGILMNGIQ